MQTSCLLGCPTFWICLIVSLWLLHCSSVPHISSSWEGGLEASLDFFDAILCPRVRRGDVAGISRPTAGGCHCWGSLHLVKGATARSHHVKVTFLFVVRLLQDDMLSPCECLASSLLFTCVSGLSSLLHWVCKMELFSPFPWSGRSTEKCSFLPSPTYWGKFSHFSEPPSLWGDLSQLSATLWGSAR